MAKTSLSISVKIDGLKETQRKLKLLPDDAKKELVDASFELSQDLAKAMRGNARSQGRQAALLTGTVATGEKELPQVSVGGSSPVGRHHKAAYKVLFGSEFGAKFLKQFKPRNTSGYWVYPAVDSMRGEIAEKWDAAAQRVIDNFCDGA